MIMISKQNILESDKEKLSTSLDNNRYCLIYDSKNLKVFMRETTNK